MSKGPQIPNKLEHWSVERLKPYERNARTHSPEQVAQIAASIVEFGFTNPILVDGKDGIIAGHGRLEAAKVLNLSKVPVIQLDHLSEEQKRAYVIADNKIALNAGWDLDALNFEIGALRDLDFNIEVIGFSDEELAALNDNDWETDLEETVTKAGENLEGIQGKVVVRCDSTYIDEIKEAIRMYVDSHAIQAEIQ